MIRFTVLLFRIILLVKKKFIMIKALLHYIHKDKKRSLKVIDSFKMIEQKFKTFEGKILRLQQIEQFCISKNMALILYVLRMRPCFLKCKIQHLERVLEFSLKQVKLQNQFFSRIPLFFLPFLLSQHSFFIY